MSTPLPKLLIVEDEIIIAFDLEATLIRRDYEVLPIALSAQEAIASARLFSPDLVLMDICLQGAPDGVEAAQEIHQRFGVPVVFLTAHVDPLTLQRARQVMPYGFVSKPWQLAQLDTTLRLALQQHTLFRILSGSGDTSSATASRPHDAYPLTPRQCEVIQLVAAGKSNKEIAAELRISIKTVEFHKTNLMNSLQLRTTAELTRFAVRQGLVCL